MSKIQMFGKMGKMISNTAGRSGLVLRKYSPEILMATGVIGVITSTVMACRSTLKVDEVLDTHNEKIAKIKEAIKVVDKETYSEADYKKDLAVTYVQTAVDFAKLYGPSVTLGLASIGCLLGSFGIMRRRNIAMIAAYKAIEESFSKYRKRVVLEFGEDKDRQFKNGISKVKVIEAAYTDENGEKHKAKTSEIEVVDPNAISDYARFFDSSCTAWSPSAEYNLTFLKVQQNFANDILQSKGHIFLNEIYDALGIPRTSAGQVVGWVKGNGKDDFVDFGIFDATHEGYRGVKVCDTIGEERRDFVNGYRDSILLDFNVDGTIYDKI